MSEEPPADKPKLPRGWQKVCLPQIAEINPALDRGVAGDAVVVNFVPMRAVEPEGGGLLRPELRPYGEVKKGYTAFLSGDVIMAKITPCMENGKTTVVPELPGSVCFGSTEFHVMRPENGVEARWISNFLLQHEVRRAAQRAMGGGVGQMRVPSAFLETAEIPLPPTVEQQRIADALDELLSDLDAGVAAIERVLAKLAQYRASVLKAAVEGALTADWRKKHRKVEPASALLTRILAERRRRWEEDQLRRFKDAGKEPPKDWKAKYKEPVAPDTTNLPELPETWCWASVDQLCSEVRNGYSLKPDSITGVPILRISSVRPLVLDLEDIRHLSGVADDYTEFLVKPGDLLFTRYNGTRSLVGVCAVVPGIARDIIHPDKLIRGRMLAGFGSPNFVAIASNVGASRDFLRQRIRTTAGQAGVSGSDIKQTPVPFPPSAEQDAITEVVEDQLSVIQHLEVDLAAKLKSAQALRQSILRHAFTGQLVPQEPKDEPAAELLKRIAAEREERAVRTPRRGTRPTKPPCPGVGRLPSAGGAAATKCSGKSATA